MERILNNGLKLPKIGMGTYPLQGEALTEAMCAAVDCGYRLFDTAHSYGNEESFGESLQEIFRRTGMVRGQLLLTTKVGEHLRHGIGDGKLFYQTFPGEQKPIFNTVKAQIEKSLQLFQTDYLDIVLIHWPYPDFLNEIWHSLEHLYKEGKIRCIGVSNFRERHLNHIFSQCEIKPMINQIEVSPLNTKEHLIEFCHEQKILIQVYSPLMSLRKKKVQESVLLKKLCLKYQCSMAQLILRWNIERGLMPLPKSGSPKRLWENFNLNFSLEMEDVIKISSLNENYQYLPESIYCPGY